MSWSVFRPSAPKIKPVDWRETEPDTAWVGSIGYGYWSYHKLFKVNKENFIESGEVFCLSTPISDCTCCFTSLKSAQEHAQKLLQDLVNESLGV